MTPLSGFVFRHRGGGTVMVLAASRVEADRLYTTDWLDLPAPDPRVGYAPTSPF